MREWVFDRRNAFEHMLCEWVLNRRNATSTPRTRNMDVRVCHDDESRVPQISVQAGLQKI